MAGFDPEHDSPPPRSRPPICLSRGTIIPAFDELRAEGYIDGTVGSGSYVSRILPETLLQAP